MYQPPGEIQVIISIISNILSIILSINNFKPTQISRFALEPPYFMFFYIELHK